jgi:fucose permease
VAPLLTFIALGLPAGALGVAWPAIRATFEVPLGGLGLLLGLGSLASLATTVLTGFLSERLGPNGLVVSACAGSAITLLALAAAPSWWVVLAAWVLWSALTGPLDAGINASLALHRGMRLMGWLHASWALGAAIGPATIGAAALLSGSWRPAYAAIGITWAALGLMTLRWRPYVKSLPAAAAPTPQPSPLEGEGELLMLQRPVLIAAAVFFVNVGVEISSGQWPFTQLTAGRGLDAKVAGWGAALFWLALTGGRAGLGIAGHRLSSSALLNGSAVLAVVGSLAFWLLPAPLAALLALPALGLSSSVVVPVVYKLLPQRVGPQTSTRATGYVAAAGLVGGAVIPPAIGLGFQLAGPWVLGPALVALTIAFGVLQRAFSAAPPPPSRLVGEGE